MLRLFSCCVAVCFLPIGFLAVAQDDPPLKANAETSAMIARYRKELGGLQAPDAHGAALCRLLNFQLRFDDKGPATETVKSLIALTGSLDKEPIRTQLLEAVVFAQSELGDYDAAVKVIEMITKPQERAENQLNLAEKFLDENEKKSNKPFDVAVLLRKAADGAAEAKDPGLEALALAVLGGELLRANKVEDAKTVLQQSREQAGKLEELEERNVLALIVRNYVRGGLTTEAVALVESMKTDETKTALTGMVAVTEAQNGRLDAARKRIDAQNPGNARDNALVELGRVAAKTESAAMLLELSQAMSLPERVDMFQQEIILRLAEEKRFDVAEEFVKTTADPKKGLAALVVRRLEMLIDDKKIDDAAKLIETLTDSSLKTGAIHHLAAACVDAGEVAVAERLLEGLRSTDEIAALKELTAAATKAAAETNIDIRTETQFEILRAQLQLLDLKSARQTLVSLFESVRKIENPVQQIPRLLVLAQVWSQLDKSQSKAVLQSLFTLLVGIKDPMVLKELVPQKQPDAERADPSQPVLVLDLPVDESAVKEQFFILYVNIANLLVQVGDDDMAKQALGKATEMLAAEPELAVKLEKMLLVAQIYASLAASASDAVKSPNTRL